MASLFFVFSVLLITATTNAISPNPVSLENPIPESHFNTILDAILSAGNFRNWANLLAELNPSTIPFSATIFVPDDAAFLAASSSTAGLTFIDPLLFPYHIIPHRFSFSELVVFPTGARLPTLLASNTLLITNNSAVNFTVNNAKIVQPDLYLNGAVSVHGVGGVLEYTRFGTDDMTTEVDVSETTQTRDNGVPPAVVDQLSGGLRSLSGSCSWVAVVVALSLMRVVGN
ncbi:fasciclin-like arabinogalactan protein 21 [Silene latifolia]|uniref:fasciclin-like arabinogalactan protein 21 n=1 Tax=Silene latifolia TaxID=37657 RepID=UPI003D782DFA